jgi:hypothetical protein
MAKFYDDPSLVREDSDYDYLLATDDEAKREEALEHARTVVNESKAKLRFRLIPRADGSTTLHSRIAGLDISIGKAVKLEITHRAWLRVGAIKGQILDADGSTVLYDLFNEFGVTPYSEVDFDLDNQTPTEGIIKKKCHDIRRKIEDELGAQPYDHIHAFCGAAFFDDLIVHPEIKSAYERYLDGLFLRQGQARGSFEYAGIVFEEYRGKVGTVDYTDANKANFFPVGVPGLFRQYNAPADFVETANTIGLPRYAKQAVDQEFGRWVKVHTQSNPLPICTRPRTLIKAKRT